MNSLYITQIKKQNNVLKHYFVQHKMNNERKKIKKDETHTMDVKKLSIQDNRHERKIKKNCGYAKRNVSEANHSKCTLFISITYKPI